MKKIDSVILDVDGTLWDSTPIVAEAWTKAIREHDGGDITVTADMLKNLFGRTMTMIADMLLPELKPEKRYAVMDVCCEYEHHALEENTEDICYPMVRETIRTLTKELPVFIVSNCQSGYIELFLEKTGLGDVVKDLECFGNTGRCKSDNISLLMQRNNLQFPIYVGDTQGDCDASKGAGIPFVYAAYGFGTADQMDGKIEQFAELADLVKGGIN